MIFLISLINSSVGSKEEEFSIGNDIHVLCSRKVDMVVC